MHIRNKRMFRSSIIAMIALLLFFSACTPAQSTATEGGPSSTAQPTTTITSVPTDTPTPMDASMPLPQLTLQKGDFYFTINGRQSVLFSRNLAGYEPLQYIQLLQLARKGGSQLVRIQLDSMGTGITSSGEIDETWAKNWESVFDEAAKNGILILPVFSGWFDWNDGTPNYGYSTWKANAFNVANGGPATSPGELFKKDSATQKMWFQWMEALVERWQGRENIAAWEIFSEVNIASGTNEANGVAFIEQAAAIIRNADSHRRPITASLADVGEWPGFYRSDAIDFINIHPYPYDVHIDLGSKVITDVHSMLTKYNKPVIIGESGLNTFLPDSKSGSGVLPNAQLGLKHAIWAEMVSGAMNGRSLYWEDGFAIFFPTLSWNYLEKSAALELPAVNFSNDVDFAGFRPLDVKLPSGTRVEGAILGNDRMMIGWFRDADCEPPDWRLQQAISGQTVTVAAPGSASEWRVDFYDTRTGTDMVSSATTVRQGDDVIILLPVFTDDIAFKMFPVK